MGRYVNSGGVWFSYCDLLAEPGLTAPIVSEPFRASARRFGAGYAAVRAPSPLGERPGGALNGRRPAIAQLQRAQLHHLIARRVLPPCPRPLHADCHQALARRLDVELALQGPTVHGNGSLIEGDRDGLASRLGEVLIAELTARRIDFVSYDIVEGPEQAFFEALGFLRNTGMINYVLDRRPYVTAR
jgi:hypothetical protein